MPKGDKYIELTNYLNNSKHKNQKLTFKGIETIIGFGLPASARSFQQWWENDHYHSQAVAWQNAGYNAQDVSILNEEVYFVKIN